MKQKTISTAKATLFVVEVSETTRNVVLFGDDEIGYYADGINKYTKLPKRRWNMLGRLPDITEEQLSEVVEFKNVKSEYQCDCCGYDVDCYRNYVDQDENAWIDNPVADRAHNDTDSFYSLLQANEVWFENKYGETIPFAFEEDAIERQLWRGAQSKVWDKERTFLFIKVD